MSGKSAKAYGKLCTQFYDLHKPQAQEESLQYYISCAKRCFGPILEPMCGSGRYLIPMMEQGFSIQGFDSSPSMLEACKEKCLKKRAFSPNTSSLVWRC